MQRDPSKQIDLNPFQYFIIISKYEKQLHRCFPSVRIVYEKEYPILYAKNNQIINEAERKIKSMVEGYHIQVIGVQPGFDVDCNQIIYLEQDFDLRVFDEKQIKRQFENLKKKHAYHIVRILKSKMKNNKQSIIIIVQNKDFKQVVSQIKQIQKNRSKEINKLDILSLELSSKQIIGCFLMQLFNKNNLDKYYVDLITKDNTLAVQGDTHDCKDFSLVIKDQLKRKQTLIMNSENEAISKKILNTNFNFEEKIFSSNHMKRVCQDISKKYHLQEIMNIYQQTKKSKQFFIVVIVPIRYKHEIKQQILVLVDKQNEKASKNIQISNQNPQIQRASRASKTSRLRKHDTTKLVEIQKQPVKKQQLKIIKELIISKQIPQKYFDENSLKAYFEDIDCSEEEKIDFKQDIRVSVKKNLVQINLELYPPISPKKKQIFKEYFQSKEFFFVKEVNQKIIQRIIEKLKGNHSDIVLTVEFVQGFSPYTYQEIESSQACKNDLIKRVKSDGIKQNPRCNKKFYCFVVKGIKTQLVYYSDKIVSDTIIQMQQQQFRGQNWCVKIPQIVHKYIKIDKVQKYLQKYVQKQIKHGSLNSMKIIQSSNNQSMIECDLILDKSLTLSEMKSLKSDFDKVFYDMIVQTVAQNNIPLQKLSTLFGNSLFVKDSNNIIQIGFIHFNEHSNYFKKSIQNCKRKEVIKFPIELLQCLKKSDAIKFDGKIQIHEDINNSRIILQSYDWIVDTSKKSIKAFIKKQTQNIRKKSYLLSKDVYDQLRSQGSLNKIFNSFKLTFQTNGVQFSRHRCQLPNGNRIIIDILPYQQSLLTFQLYFDQNLFSLFGFLKNSEKKNGHLINYENKVIYVNKKHSLKPLQDFKQKFTMAFDQNHLGYLIEQYHQFKLQDLILFSNDQTKILNSLNSYSSKNIINIKQYGWIQNNQEMPYTDKTQKIINQKKQSQQSFILDQDSLDLKDKFFVFNKSTNILVYKRNSQTFALTKDTLNKQYFITLNTNQIPILKNQYDEIQTSRDDEVKVRLALYYLNFEKMTQTNLFTNFQRKLYQKQVSPQAKQNTSLKLDIKHSKIQYKSSQISFNIHKDWSSLPQLKDEITKSIHRLHQQQVNLTLKLNVMSLQNLLNICDEKNVEVKYKEQQGKENTLFVKLVGYNIVMLKQICQDYKALENNSFIQSVVPDYWTVQQQQIVTVQVDKNSPQFQNIQKKFGIAKIKKLLRIQNQIIWKKYAQQKKDLEYITQQTIKQQFLYHGTRQYNPQKIYKDKQESFNINFSSDRNYFGRGIYFAAQAAYCNSYSYKSALNKQILYCRVLVGKSQIMTINDRNQQIKDTIYRDQRKGIKYESIKSVYTECNNTEVYIIYKSRRAYPEYLIQY